MSVTFDDLQGRVLDTDSHEMIPYSRYGSVFGDRARRLIEIEANARFFEDAEKRYRDISDLGDHDDIMEITAETVWETKGTAAPGATDIERRPALLDAMGIHRQLMFPGFGLFAFAQAHGLSGVGPFAVANEEQRAIAKEAVDAYNEWAGSLTSKYPDRIRIVGLLPSGRPGVTPESLVAETENLLSMGVKALLASYGMPPAGLSPADPALDPFYATLADANVALVLHPPAGIGFRTTEVWGRPSGVPGGLPLQGPEENFIWTITVGGVFERHPTLRVGAIETGSYWIGPLAELLDAAFETGSRAGVGVAAIGRGLNYSLRPSEYLARNVRVSALLHEPVEKWLERYPQLQDVYCYSSDYPHVEGQAWSLQEFYGRIAPLGDDVVEKFFCTNAQLLLP